MSYRLSTVAEPAALDLLTVVRRTAAELGITWMVIGAFARDLWLRIHDIPIERATADIDIGVQVSDWSSYQRLCAALLAEPDLAADARGVAHRLVFRGILPLDLVPSGRIAPDGEIAWPPDGEPRMTVSGSDHVPTADMLLPDRTVVRVCALPGLVYLKLLAWQDNPHRTRDLEDIYLILRRYIEAGHEARLEGGVDADLVAVDDFDYDCASASLLGRDLARAMSPPAIQQILPIVDNLTAPAAWAGAEIPDFDSAYRRSYTHATRLATALRANLHVHL